MANLDTDGVIETLTVGCKVPVENKDNFVHQAEILAVRKSSSTAAQPATEFYVHYINFNKRLDEWVPISRLRITSSNDIEYPKSKKKASSGFGGSLTKKGGVANSKKSAQRKRQKIDSKTYVDSAGNDDSVETDEKLEENWSKEKEIEKLRTSGSMTQSHAELSRVKNLDYVVMGRHQVEAWYFSPYPEEFAERKMAFICEFCLEGIGTLHEFERHRRKCSLRHPPGNEIYRKGDLSFYEIDGRKQRHYCRNLCLLSKLFLDHKTLYYDVDPFLFYLMTKNDEYGSHLLGYFSKEKESAESYNVACILTLPQHQRMGYGKILIEFSYELSKIEGRAGSPEKPLSDLGLLSYRSYWQDAILDKLYKYKGEITIEELSKMTSITCEDIMATLQNMEVLKYYKGQHVICLNNENLAYWEKQLKKKKVRIDPKCLQWTPPHFSASQLRFL